jgi:hypothetical protein
MSETDFRIATVSVTVKDAIKLDITSATAWVDDDDYTLVIANITNNPTNPKVASSDATICTATISGKVISIRGVKVGTATLTVSADSFTSSTITVTVQALDTLKMTLTETSFKVGGSVTGIAITSDILDSPLPQYTNSDDKIATITIDSDSKAFATTGVKAGSSNVVVRAHLKTKNLAKATIALTVTAETLGEPEAKRSKK